MILNVSNQRILNKIEIIMGLCILNVKISKSGLAWDLIIDFFLQFSNFDLMNILEEQEHNPDELRRCKIQFLQTENTWMSSEQQFIDQLIKKYKQVIEFSHTNEPEESMVKLREQIRNQILKKIEEYNAIKELQKQPEPEITNEQFFTMIQSFENKIVRLQGDIVNRENQLQQMEDQKGKHSAGRDRKIQIRCITNIQGNGKLIQKIRKEIGQLKTKKNRLENKVLAGKEGLFEEDETLPTMKNSQSLKQENQMSLFEKAVIILKKKRIENEMIQQKIRLIKNRLAQKRFNTQRLQRQIQVMEWKCLQGIQGCNGFIDSNCEGDISVNDRSLNPSSMSFSFDVSRFIKPKNAVRE